MEPEPSSLDDYQFITSYVEVTKMHTVTTHDWISAAMPVPHACMPPCLDCKFFFEKIHVALSLLFGKICPTID
jgi:hypothetical protein